jgi:hypothetical protein
MMIDESKRRRRRAWRSLAVTIVLALATTLPANAGTNDAPIAVGEISPPPAGSGIDASVLRDAAAAEIRQIDPSRLPDRRKFVVSLALIKAVAEETIACTVNATVRDAHTGAMLAIIEGGAHADGPASPELRKQVAHAAVRSAVRRIPNAVGGK